MAYRGQKRRLSLGGKEVRAVATEGSPRQELRLQMGELSHCQTQVDEGGAVKFKGKHRQQ